MDEIKTIQFRERMQKFPEIRKEVDTGKLYINLSHLQERTTELKLKIDQRIRKYDREPVNNMDNIINDAKKVELLLVRSWIDEIILRE